MGHNSFSQKAWIRQRVGLPWTGRHSLAWIRPSCPAREIFQKAGTRAWTARPARRRSTTQRLSRSAHCSALGVALRQCGMLEVSLRQRRRVTCGGGGETQALTVISVCLYSFPDDGGDLGVKSKWRIGHPP